MSSAALRAEIRKLVDTFVADLETVVRRAALETVAEALGSSSRGPATAVRGGAASPRMPRAPAHPSTGATRARRAAPDASSGGRVRRNAEQIGATEDRIVQHVEQHPGTRAEDIRAALGLARNEWTLTVKRLVEGGRLVSRGNKRATVYFTKAPRPLGIIKRPGRGAPPAAEPEGGSPD